MSSGFLNILSVATHSLFKSGGVAPVITASVFTILKAVITT
jgi:hypothetical protein